MMEEKSSINNDHRPDVGDDRAEDSSESTQPEEANAEVIGDAARIAELEHELAEYKDRLYRTAADSENLRKRFEKDRQNIVKYSLENVFKDLLPVLDSFDNALNNIRETQPDGENDSVFSGMQMVHRQMLDILGKHGLIPVEAIGKAFDPNLHQAMQRVTAEGYEADQVVQEYAKGYLLHERLLRPAMVTVAQGD